MILRISYLQSVNIFRKEIFHILARLFIRILTNYRFCTYPDSLLASKQDALAATKSHKARQVQGCLEIFMLCERRQANNPNNRAIEIKTARPLSFRASISCSATDADLSLFFRMTGNDVGGTRCTIGSVVDCQRAVTV